MMSPKRIIMAGTVAFVITLAMWSEESGASAAIAQLDKSSVRSNVKEACSTIQSADAPVTLREALGASSDEEVYDALYIGKSLADIAEENGADVQNVIDLQVAELTEQLDKRLASGSIPPDVYEAQKLEVADIITRSVYGGT